MHCAFAALLFTALCGTSAAEEDLATFSVDALSGTGHHDYTAAPPAELQGDFFLACMAGDVPVVRDMLAQGASLAAPDGWGRAPLALAAINGRHQLVAALLELGADAGAADGEGRTALDAVQVLLREAGEPGSGRDAARAGDLEAVRRLLARALVA